MNAETIIERMQTFPQTQTEEENQGDNFELFPWQRRFIRNTFRPHIKRSNLSVGRGAGKTTLTAMLACVFICDFSRKYYSDLVIVSGAYDQSELTFRRIVETLERKYKSESLKKELRIIDSTGKKMIENRETKLRIRCISSDPARAHGLQIFPFVLADEPAKWPHAEKMWAALRTSQTKFKNSKIINLGTQPNLDTHFFSRLLHSKSESDYSQLHAVPPDYEERGISLFSKRAWRMANPSIDYRSAIEDEYRDLAKLAKKDINSLFQLKSLYLNMGTEETDQPNYLISPDTWRACEINGLNIERAGYQIWGIDLSGGNALSALSAYWTESGYLESIALVGDEPSLAKRGELDGVGTLYLQFANEESLITSRGRAADIDTLLQAALLRFGKPDLIVCDRYKQNEFLDALRRCDLYCEVSFRGMGYRDGSEDVERFRKMALTGKIKAKTQQIARHCFGGCRGISDPAGNEKISKNTQGGRRLRHRDDVAVSSVLAVAAGNRIQERFGNQSDFDIVIV